MMAQGESIYKRYDKLAAEVPALKDRILGYQDQIHNFKKVKRQELEAQRVGFDEIIAKLTAENAALIAEVARLSEENARLKSVASHNGTNTGLPTAQTPIGKKKVIPNTRIKTGKKRGGQVGHRKHFLPPFNNGEVTETVVHKPDCICPECGGDMVDTGEAATKDEYDVRIVVEKKRHRFSICRCDKCGKAVRAPIPDMLKEPNQYGPGMQALALSLMNTGNVPINKVSGFFSGVSGGGMQPCEGYIAKLQSRAVDGLASFVRELKSKLIQSRVVYWDDTVVAVNKSRACLRFYGDDKISLFAAHEAKGLDGLKDDGILELLDSETFAMHDHNRVNYNGIFRFKNIECNQHLERDLQKNSDDSGHAWSVKYKELIAGAIHDRKIAVSHGDKCFSPEYISGFRNKSEKYLAEGFNASNSVVSKHIRQPERALLRRIEEYYANFFAWFDDFSLPTTNNLSERGLRCVKSHMKISGQFQNINSARNYAAIKTYIETCRKNGINEHFALVRLCSGNPITVGEIFV